MLKNAKKQDATIQAADRRSHARVHVRSVAYVELGEENGGLILNIAEGGIAVQSAEMIVGDRFPRMRFRLPKSEKWIETEGKLAWLGKSRKEAGIQFIDLDTDARRQIQDWVYSAAFRPGLPVEQGRFKLVWEVEEPVQTGIPTSEHITGIESAEIDSMFPSEKSLSSSTPTVEKKRVPVEHSSVEVSSVDTGIAPGPVKRPRPPLTEAQGSSWHSYKLPLVRATGQPDASTEQPFSSQETQEYRSPNPSSTRDPFASVVADQAEAADTRGPVFGSGFRGGETSASSLREHFKGLGYHPPPFEEPSGKGWLVAGAILIALLGVGTVLAMGPANVQSLLTHYISAAISSASASIAGPPPPAVASEKTPSAGNFAHTPAGASSSAPINSGPQQSIVNPGVASQDPEQPQSSEPRGTIRQEKRDSEPPPPAIVPTRPFEPGPPQTYSEESLENAEAITHRFQMEHSYSNRVLADRSPAGNAPYAQAGTPTPNPPPVSRNEKTLDAYEQATSAAPNSSGPIAPPAPATPQAPALPTGTVAISSHFRSLRGEDPQATLSRRGLVIGQVASIRQPVYPVEAEREHVEGTVQLRATVDQTGRVEIVQAISGPPILIPAAIEAVRDWRYAQTIVNARAMESVNDVTVVFRLANSAASPR
jgi:Gram-negative bacterial TonB protein C-terminal/PilZ domain